MLYRKRKIQDPIYIHLKKHYCPVCGTRLIADRVYHVVSSEDPEASDYDFSAMDGGRLRGEVEFSWQIFRCPNCDVRYKIEVIRMYEFEVKWANRGLDGKERERIYLRRKSTAAIIFSAGLTVFAYLIALAYMYFNYIQYMREFYVYGSLAALILFGILFSRGRDK